LVIDLAATGEMLPIDAWIPSLLDDGEQEHIDEGADMVIDTDVGMSSKAMGKRKAPPE